jgi:kynurenine formamidase
MHDRWRGWRPLPPPAPPPPAAGPWLDLSHPLSPELAAIPFFPPARFTRIMRMPTDPLNVTEMQMVCHFGTHVDAPCHFIADGPAFHQIPLERLHGPGVVWRVDAGPYQEIDAGTLAGLRPAAEPGDIVLLDAGWADRVGTKEYERNPALTVDAADWLVARGVKLVGVDFATPDLAVDRRPPGFGWPVHHVLLSQGVLIAENLTNLRPLAGRRIAAMFLALNVVGADGGPVRAVGRVAG